LNLNVDDRDERRMEKLAALLGLNRTDAIRLAVGAMLAAMEAGQPVLLAPPSELVPAHEPTPEPEPASTE
jgi:hypothetical protein